MPSRLRLCRASILPAALFSALTFSAPALAQDIALAEALFNRGLADMKAGKYETGCKAIAESHRLDPHPGTLFTLAVCERRSGHIATASARYGEYLALYDRLPADQKASQAARAKEATAQRAALGPQVPQLFLELPADAPATTVVSRNGVALAPAALGMELPVDPGEHVLTTQAAGGPVWEQRIALGKGEKKKLTLEVKPPPPPESPPQKIEPLPPKAAPPQMAGPALEPPVEGPSGQRVGAIVVGSAGVIGLVLGGVMGGLTLQRKGVIADNCMDRVNMTSLCNQTGLDATESGKALALGSTLGFSVGALALGTAAVLFFTEPKPAKPALRAQRPWMTITAGVLGAGPLGTTVGVRGRW